MRCSFEVPKLTQIMERYQDRMAQINEALREVPAEEQAERERVLMAEESIAVQREAVAERQKRNELKGHLEAAERTLRDEREQAVAEQELREAQYSQRECAGKLERLSAAQHRPRKLVRVAEDLARCEESARQPGPGGNCAAPQEALEQRVD